MDIHLVRVPQDVDVVMSGESYRNEQNVPHFFPAHVDSYAHDTFHWRHIFITRTQMQFVFHILDNHLFILVCILNLNEIFISFDRCLQIKIMSVFFLESVFYSRTATDPYIEVLIVRFEPSGVGYKDASAVFNNVATDTQICYTGMDN